MSSRILQSFHGHSLHVMKRMWMINITEKIQNSKYLGILLNGNNYSGAHAQHTANIPIFQMQGNKLLSIILFIFKLPAKKTI